MASASSVSGTTWKGSVGDAEGNPGGNRAPTLTLTSPRVPSLTTGQSYAIVLRVADPDGNLASVDVDWNDGSPVMRQTVSGSQESVIFTRRFTTPRQINWSASAYDKEALASSPLLQGSFEVKAPGNRIDGFAFRTKGTVFEATPVFFKRLGDSPLPIDSTVRTWIVIHGRDSSSEEMAEIVNAIAAMRTGDQILALDWSAAADGLLTSAGEGWIQPVGEWAARTLASYGFLGSNLNLIGHSWGSYVAAELAELMPFNPPQELTHKVNSIVGLDPAADTNDSSYNVNVPGTINFGQFSNCSWAFHATRIYGNEHTPTTAGEAFVVTFKNVSFEFEMHSKVKGMFAYMIQHPTQDPNNYFQLDRLLSCRPGPWVLNRFTPGGLRQAGGEYEAQIDVRATGSPSFEEVPYAIDFDALPAPNGPVITGASVNGKKLLVSGFGFDDGAKILLDGEPQKKTVNDVESPTTLLIGKKVGKLIAPGQRVSLQIQNSDGSLSNVIPFTRTP